MPSTMHETGDADKEKPRKRGVGGPARRKLPRRSPPAGHRTRPSTAELFAAVVELVSSRASAFRGTARRYSLCAADADDAYQRGLEILITKAPTASPSELQPWLHTVIKHEALALRRQRERLLAGGPDAPGETAVAESVPSPDEGAAERQRMNQTAEALGELKPGEIQCLLLKALGYSYGEISARTGFSWTKVNRSLTEGRKRFFSRFGQIESGERCESFAPLLSAASDGEASPEDERRLKAHLRSCHSCRAVLRGFRTVPIRLAQLLPPVVLAPTTEKGGWWSRLYDSLVVGTSDRAAAIGYKLQHVGELVTAQKTAAVVASTAALAGGAAVHERASDQRPAEKRTEARRGASQSPTPRVAATTPQPRSPTPQLSRVPAGAEQADSSPAVEAGSGEFGPEGVAVERSRATASSKRTPPEPMFPVSGAGTAARSSSSTATTTDRGTSSGSDRAGASEFGP